jgi:hypothetical protein
MGLSINYATLKREGRRGENDWKGDRRGEAPPGVLKVYWRPYTRIPMMLRASWSLFRSH